MFANIEPYGPWSKVVHYIGNRVPFGTHLDNEKVSFNIQSERVEFLTSGNHQWGDILSALFKTNRRGQGCGLALVFPPGSFCEFVCVCVCACVRVCVCIRACSCTFVQPYVLTCVFLYRCRIIILIIVLLITQFEWAISITYCVWPLRCRGL